MTRSYTRAVGGSGSSPGYRLLAARLGMVLVLAGVMLAYTGRGAPALATVAAGSLAALAWRPGIQAWRPWDTILAASAPSLALLAPLAGEGGWAASLASLAGFYYAVGCVEARHAWALAFAAAAAVLEAAGAARGPVALGGAGLAAGAALGVAAFTAVSLTVKANLAFLAWRPVGRRLLEASFLAPGVAAGLAAYSAPADWRGLVAYSVIVAGSAGYVLGRASGMGVWERRVFAAVAGASILASLLAGPAAFPLGLIAAFSLVFLGGLRGAWSLDTVRLSAPVSAASAAASVALAAAPASLAPEPVAVAGLAALAAAWMASTLPFESLTRFSVDVLDHARATCSILAGARGWYASTARLDVEECLSLLLYGVEKPPSWGLPRRRVSLVGLPRCPVERGPGA